MDGRKMICAFLFLAVTISLSGCCCCVPPEPPEVTPTPGPLPSPYESPINPQGAEWTYIVYMDGDNNLEEAAIYDFLEMERVGSTENVKIVMQFDRSSGYYSGEGDWSGARRFLLQRGDGNSIVSQPVQDLGETDMSSPETLYDFASWAIDNYPAQKYALVLWNHGGGWTGLLHDEGADKGMFLPEMKQALDRIKGKLGRKLDVLVFDMCLMAQYDVALDVEPDASYMVGSEETVPGYSFDYSQVLGTLSSNPQMSPRELAVMEVDKFREFYSGKDDATTMSALDLSQVPALQSAYTDFATGLTTHVNSGKWKDVAEMHMYAENYPVGMSAEDARAFSFGDLYDFASNAEAYSVGDAAPLLQKAVALQSAINQTVIANYNHAKHPRSHGISYYFQPSKSLYGRVLTSQYERTDAYNQPQWKSFLSAYYSSAPESVEQPRIGSFMVSRAASLARPVRFSYEMSGQNIVANRWAQFYQEGGEWKLARLINQRAATTLPNGKVVYGFPGGIGQGAGMSSPVEMFVTDGSAQVRASVEQLWPAENFYAVDGMLRKRSGEQADARLYFHEMNGTLARIQAITTGPNGQPTISYLPFLDDGDQFTPYIYILAPSGLTPRSSGQALTYNTQHGFSIGWRPLQSGDYMVADILLDLSNQTGYAAAALHVGTQPALHPLQPSDLAKTWDCAQVEQAVRVHRVMVLDLSGGGCRFEDVTGNATCVLTYSEEGAPHIYINLPERFETYKFLVSRLNDSAIWLFSSAAGDDPIYCFVRGSEVPTLQVYRDLYTSVGDPATDLEEQSLDPECLLGQWENLAKNMTFGFWAGYHAGGSEATWRIGSHELFGQYSADGRILNFTATHPSTEYSTTFYYLCSQHKLVLYDLSNNMLVFNRPGVPLPSAPNDPAPAVQPGGVQPQPTPPTPPAPPATLVGTWQNPAAAITLMLDPAGNYILLDGYNYYYGSYSVEGNVLLLNYAGTTVRYYYALSGDQLTLQGNGVTVTLTRAQTYGPP